CPVECPHRLSDKLLKSVATFSCGAGCVYYAFRFASQAFNSLFLTGRMTQHPADTVACKPLFRVSGGAL
ncbi:hypothetical protein CIG19_20675, partial [Enterobacterales bacterium CwR94]